MVRIKDILDPELRKRVTAALAERAGVSAASIPLWYEMDDADYSQLLVELDLPPADLEPPADPRE